MDLSKIYFLFDIYDDLVSFVFLVTYNPWLISNFAFLAVNKKSSISDNTIRLYSKNVKTNKLSKSLKCLYQYSRKLTANIIVTQPSFVMQNMLWLFGYLVLLYLFQVKPIFQIIIIDYCSMKKAFYNISYFIFLSLQEVDLIWILDRKVLSHPPQTILGHYDCLEMKNVSKTNP